MKKNLDRNIKSRLNINISYLNNAENMSKIFKLDIFVIELPPIENFENKNFNFQFNRDMLRNRVVP